MSVTIDAPGSAPRMTQSSSRSPLNASDVSCFRPMCHGRAFRTMLSSDGIFPTTAR